MCKIELGIDTFSYYYKLTSRQKAEIIGHLKAKEGFFWGKKKKRIFKKKKK